MTVSGNAPKGPQECSQGRRPWNPAQSRFGAPKGRKNRILSPLRGSAFSRNALPRAFGPGYILAAPSGPFWFPLYSVNLFR